MNRLYIYIALTFLAGCGGEDLLDSIVGRQTPAELKVDRLGTVWIAQPQGFQEYKKESFRKANWKYSSIPILNGQYTIGVGPYEFKEPDDGIYDYYSIDLEKPYDGGSMVVAELSLPLEYVSEEALALTARDLVHFDSKSNVITYNLGKSKFQLELKMPSGEQGGQLDAASQRQLP